MKTIFLLLLFFCNSLQAQTAIVNQTSENPLDYIKSNSYDLLDENGIKIFNTNEIDSLQMTGESINNYFGRQVSNAGDVNGDGYSDVIVSAYNYGFGVGRVYIYYGGLSMDNVADVTMTGETYNTFGYSISTAGDVNGDGFSDVIIGAPDVNMIFYVRRAYIFLGGSSMDNVPDVMIAIDESVFSFSVSTAGDVNGDGFSDVIISSHIEGNGRAYIFYGGVIMNNLLDVTLTGNGFLNFGRTVSTAGDINGDGFSDVIVSALGNNSDTSRVFIFYGGVSMDNIVDVTLFAESINTLYGYSVSIAGDVNGDGYSDVIVGDYNYNATYGRAYVYFGGTSMNSIADVILNSEGANNYYGFSVSTAGDINGDGFSDVIVGCNNYNNRYGRAYLYNGGINMDNIADVIYTGEASLNDFGASVSSAGDVNGDGYSDIIVGASNFSNGTGRAYIFTNLIPKPVLVNPVNNSTNNPLSINFKWRKFNSAMHYILIVSTNSSFNNVIVNDTISIDTSKSINGFQKGKQYFWKVRVKDTFGVEKNSPVWNFTTIPPIYLNLKVLMEGMYYQFFNQMIRKDTVKVYLRNITFPYAIVDSAKGIIDSLSFSNIFSFINAPSGTYYIVVKHFNSIETWSKDGGESMTTNGSIYSYDFTTSVSKAYGNNLKLKGSKYCIYGGNVNGDAIVDGGDLSEVDNDSFTGLAGRFLRSDVNGDNIVDAADVSLVDNNSYNSIVRITP